MLRSCKNSLNRESFGQRNFVTSTFFVVISRDFQGNDSVVRYIEAFVVPRVDRIISIPIYVYHARVHMLYYDDFEPLPVVRAFNIQNNTSHYYTRLYRVLLSLHCYSEYCPTCVYTVRNARTREPTRCHHLRRQTRVSRGTAINLRTRQRATT